MAGKYIEKLKKKLEAPNLTTKQREDLEASLSNEESRELTRKRERAAKDALRQYKELYGDPPVPYDVKLDIKTDELIYVVKGQFKGKCGAVVRIDNKAGVAWCAIQGVTTDENKLISFSRDSIAAFRPT